MSRGELQVVVGIILQNEDVVVPADAVDLFLPLKRRDSTCMKSSSSEGSAITDCLLNKGSQPFLYQHIPDIDAEATLSSATDALLVSRLQDTDHISKT